MGLELRYTPSAGYKPKTRFTRVVFPEPVPPIIPICSPKSASKLIFSKDSPLLPLYLKLTFLKLIPMGSPLTSSVSPSFSSGFSRQDSILEAAAKDAEKEMISETIKYAVIVVATVPILTIYPFIQKYFVKGVMVGSLKG